MKKVLKLKLEPDVHEKFRTWAFNHRVTMQGELENYVGGLVNGETPKASPRKQPLVKSGELVEVQSPASDRKSPEPVYEPPKPTPEEVEKKQRSCKHYFLGGKGGCVKCGWVPPVAY